jgi:hypothetical protein
VYRGADYLAIVHDSGSADLERSINELVKFLELRDRGESVVSVKGFEPLCVILVKNFVRNNNEAEKLCKAMWSIITGSINDSIKNILRNDNKDTCFDYIKKIFDDKNEISFHVLLNTLKDIANSKECRSVINRNFRFALDTCYDEEKARRLEDALEQLENSVSDKNKKLLLLISLAATYSHIAASASDSEKAEWWLLFLREAARRKKPDAYLPLCPGRGDVVALLYYMGKKYKDNLSLDAIKIRDGIFNIIEEIMSKS